MKRCLQVIVGIVTLAAASVVPGADQPKPSDDFSLLTQRNIFARNRAVASTRPTTVTSRPATMRAELTLVLRGTLRQDEQLVAYVENLAGGEILRVGVGDPLASGIVRQIAFESLLYEAHGMLWRVQVGQNLEGGSPELPAGLSPSTVPTTAGSDDIVERLRRRRLEGR